MSWSEIQSLFDGQGLVFWAAVTAVTLGLTLLSVSIVFQLRKVLGRKSWPKLHIRRKARRTKPVAQVVVTPDGYRPGGLVARTGHTPPADPLLNSLLARLKTSADRLERMHSTLATGAGASGTMRESALKDPSAEVDYVYQAARA